jgi:hypothetical protein
MRIVDVNDGPDTVYYGTDAARAAHNINKLDPSTAEIKALLYEGSVGKATIGTDDRLLSKEFTGRNFKISNPTLTNVNYSTALTSSGNSADYADRLLSTKDGFEFTVKNFGLNAYGKFDQSSVFYSYHHRVTHKKILLAAAVTGDKPTLTAQIGANIVVPSYASANITTNALLKTTNHSRAAGGAFPATGTVVAAKMIWSFRTSDIQFKNLLEIGTKVRVKVTGTNANAAGTVNTKIAAILSGPQSGSNSLTHALNTHIVFADDITDGAIASGDLDAGPTMTISSFEMIGTEEDFRSGQAGLNLEHDNHYIGDCSGLLTSFIKKTSDKIAGEDQLMANPWVYTSDYLQGTIHPRTGYTEGTRHSENKDFSGIIKFPRAQAGNYTDVYINGQELRETMIDVATESLCYNIYRSAGKKTMDMSGLPKYANGLIPQDVSDSRVNVSFGASTVPEFKKQTTKINTVTIGGYQFYRIGSVIRVLASKDTIDADQGLDGGLPRWWFT